MLSALCRVYTRTHVARKHIIIDICIRIQATCIRIHMLTDTCHRIHVARSGYMLTVSRQHNYYSFMSRSTYIPCIQQQTGDKLATILSPIQETCWRQQVDTTCIRQHVSWCKRGFRLCGVVTWWLKPRSHRARRIASTRPHLAYLQVMYAYSIIQLSITSLSMTSLAQVLSGGVW